MSGGTRLENANPVIFQRTGDRRLTSTDEDENVHDPIDDREIFDILFNTECFGVILVIITLFFLHNYEFTLTPVNVYFIAFQGIASHAPWR